MREADPWKLYLLMVPPTQPTANCPKREPLTSSHLTTHPKPRGELAPPGESDCLRLGQGMRARGNDSSGGVLVGLAREVFPRWDS